MLVTQVIHLCATLIHKFFDLYDQITLSVSLLNKQNSKFGLGCTRVLILCIDVNVDVFEAEVEFVH